MGGTALLGVDDDELGIDIEIDRELAHLHGMLPMICTAAERNSIDSGDPLGRSRQFLRLWTCKEALLKAAGIGFSPGFAEVVRQIEIGTLPEALLAVSMALLGRHWLVRELDLGPGLLAAVASAGRRDVQLESWSADDVAAALRTAARAA